MWGSSRRSILRRFVVHDESMLPTLAPGQGLVAIAASSARAGQIRVFEHPLRPGFWMVKRVESVSDDAMFVRSDNRGRDTVDSRQLGEITVRGSYRVLVRVPMWLM